MAPPKKEIKDPKICTTCKLLKPLCAFNKAHERFDGHSSKCKNCRKNNANKVILQFKSCSKCKLVKLIDEFHKNSRSFNGRQERCKSCRSDDKKNFYQKNKEKIHKQRNNKRREKRRFDISFKLQEDISRTIRRILRSNNGSKNGKTFLKFVSWTKEEFKKYLESQFEPWMTWGNWGKYNSKTWDDNDSSTWTWQIDHIIPQSLLPYKSMEDENFKICWSLKNLRPLSAKQNLLDGISKIRHVKEII